MSEKSFNELGREADITQFHPLPIAPKPAEDKSGERAHTLKISRREVLQGVAIKQRAHFEVRPGRHADTFSLELDEGEIIIGRSSTNGLQLDLVNVSRQHVRIFQEDEEYHLEDLGSTNGTFVNGVRVSKCVLRNNDLIDIGDARIFFVEEKLRQ